MHSITNNIILGMSALLTLCACSPNEDDFKSDVPLSTRIEMAQEALGELSEMNNNEANSGVIEEVEEESLPEAINWDVHFFSQAPYANWNAPYGETCEEASITLAHAYLTGKELTIEEFDQTLLALVDWQNETYNDDLAYEHSTVEQTAKMLEEFFDYTDYEILEDPSVDDLKSKLAEGALIVAPFAGQELENPFFTGGGPLYHMLVIKGYDETHFITNDVGTKRGENFIYSYENTMSSLSDWPVTDREKRVLVMY